MLLLHKSKILGTTISLHLSECLVTKPPLPSSSAESSSSSSPAWTSLIVPTNNYLTSTSKFKYFGSLPQKFVLKAKEERWGGMEIGSKMFYPIQCIDGLVTLYGGAEYARNLKILKDSRKKKMRVNEKPLAFGSAATCGSGGKLTEHFDEIVNVAIPFRDDENSLEVLEMCWNNALREANGNCIYVPLMGAGSRGYEKKVAIEIACREIKLFAEDSTQKEREVCLVVNSKAIGEIIAKEL
jgi:O-acetyl-ADP-ribose deacetylase (regulator of RNase III)